MESIRFFKHLNCMSNISTRFYITFGIMGLRDIGPSGLWSDPASCVCDPSARCDEAFAMDGRTQSQWD